MFTNTVRGKIQNAPKCYQMIPNAPKILRACIIPCEISLPNYPNYSQILPECIQIPPHATKWSQMLPCLYDTICHMGLCSQMYPIASKYSHMLPKTPTCIQILPNALKIYTNSSKCFQMISNTLSKSSGRQNPPTPASVRRCQTRACRIWPEPELKDPTSSIIWTRHFSKSLLFCF